MASDGRHGFCVMSGTAGCCLAFYVEITERRFPCSGERRLPVKATSVTLQDAISAARPKTLNRQHVALMGAILIGFFAGMAVSHADVAVSAIRQVAGAENTRPAALVQPAAVGASWSPRVFDDVRDTRGPNPV